VVAVEHYLTITQVNGDETTYVQIWKIGKARFDWVEENLKRVLGEPRVEGLSSLKSINAGAEAMLQNGLIIMGKAGDEE
jgi:hypothetical protein